MSERTERGTREGRRVYRKPELRQVELRAEEAVLAVCKDVPDGCQDADPLASNFQDIGS